MLTLHRCHGKIHARVCRGKHMAMAMGNRLGCGGSGQAIQKPGILCRAARSVFRRSPPKVGLNPDAVCWHGNQPDIYAAYLFNAAGRPELTQKWVRWISKQSTGIKNGLDGNDDGGTLSAWYVFARSDYFRRPAPIVTKLAVQSGRVSKFCCRTVD